jgi:ABC-2 type transport system ATP-binding protein
MNAIEMSGVRKTFGRGRRARTALNGFDLEVPVGGVHGLVGPNGSGKTTALRIIVGLVRADGGAVRLFDQDVPAALRDVIRSVGTLIEGPRLFPGFSGRRNLELVAHAAQVDGWHVQDTLEQVGLTARADQLVAGYSLGMRQRLGLACALLPAPRLLLLDEPTNGLDPEGVRDIRSLVRNLASGGITVLLCSHLLSEVQRMCEHISIVSAGRRVATGCIATLLDSRAVRVRMQADQAMAADLLTGAGLKVSPDGDALLVSGARASVVNRILAEEGLWADELTPIGAELEDVYMRLTLGSGGGATLPG